MRVNLHQQNDVLRRLTEDSLNNPRINFLFGDAFEYMRETSEVFDVVLNDIETEYTDQSSDGSNMVLAYASMFKKIIGKVFVQSDYFSPDWNFSSGFVNLIASYLERFETLKISGRIPLFQFSEDAIRYFQEDIREYDLAWNIVKYAHPNAILYFACADFTSIGELRNEEDE